MEKEKDINNFVNKIIVGDCIEELKKFPDNSVDLIFADPPYNLQLRGDLWRPNQTKVDAVNDNWDKYESFEHYDGFTLAWLEECRRVLKENGTIWVIGSYHNIFRVGKIMQDLGFWILNDILWIKTNPMPNFKGTRFNNAHETLIWASKNKDSKFTFHYKGMKSYNDDKQMRSDWYIPICLGNERLKGKDGDKVHSTQKPEALLYRIILSTSNQKDIILDPFMGSGTTGAVAKKLGRNFIGIEKEKKYINQAIIRIGETKTLAEEFLKYPIEKIEQKIPFGSLIESGFIEVGEKVFSQDRKHSAEVLSDGTLNYDEIGSIHKISAKILGKPTNNGWEFWHVERGGKLKSINELRKEFRERFVGENH
ncbi:site-specific DNA-methyltransferase [Candidatus Pacearchaeota archaeon]|nr:site-specific DNA-methyltransferase [Candidatus Pacearchaeota archaeon]